MSARVRKPANLGPQSPKFSNPGLSHSLRRSNQLKPHSVIVKQSEHFAIAADSRALDKQHSQKSLWPLVAEKEKPRRSEALFGGPEGTRTPDPLHAMQVRYQLRHRPKLP